VEAARPDDRIRLAELMAALSLATDLGLGQTLEHELGICLAALELADRLGCKPEQRSDVYYVAPLAHVGCTAGAPYFASWAGGDEIHLQSGAQVAGPASGPSEDMRYFARRFADDRPLPERARLVAKALIAGQRQFELVAANLCEGGRLLAQRLHLPGEVVRALGQVTARWDGKGVPDRGWTSGPINGVGSPGVIRMSTMVGGSGAHRARPARLTPTASGFGGTRRRARHPVGMMRRRPAADQLPA
jgi:hypothetical protein